MRTRRLGSGLTRALALLGLPIFGAISTGCPSDDGVATGGADSSSGDGTTTAPPTTTVGPSTSLETTADSSGTTSLDPDSSTGIGTSSSSESSSTSTGDPNDAPEAADDIFYTSQDLQLVVDADGVLGNDLDADGDLLTVLDADAMSAGGGTVVVDTDGAVDYTPALGFFGADSFEYTVSDGEAEATATVTVYVAPIFVPLADVAGGLNGFAIAGEQMNDEAGSVVSSAGDFDGDGLADVILAAVGTDFEGFDRDYIVFGKSDTDLVELTDVAGAMGGVAMNSEVTNDDRVRWVSDAGDVNGDGTADVVVGVSGFGGDDGRAYVVFGREGDATPIAYGDIANGLGGYPIVEEQSGSLTGRSVSGIGDVDGDGLGDLLVGAAAYDVTSPGRVDAGRVYVVFGKGDGDTLPVDLADVAQGVGGYAVDGELGFDFTGIAASGAGDVDGDGLVDIVVGAFGSDVSAVNAGRAYVVFGKADDTETVELSDVAAGIGGFAIDGEAASDAAGIAVSDAGDVNGDGLADVIVGAPAANIGGNDTGRAYVVFGKNDTTTVDLADVVAGEGGFAIDGETPADNAGGSVSSAGDINGDGLADVVVGALFSDAGGVAAAGRAYVVYGKADTTAVALADIAIGAGGFAFEGEGANNSAGASVSGAGDVNGDGFPDLVIGAPVAGLGGRAYVVFGVPTQNAAR